MTDIFQKKKLEKNLKYPLKGEHVITDTGLVNQANVLLKAFLYRQCSGIFICLQGSKSRLLY